MSIHPADVREPSPADLTLVGAPASTNNATAAIPLAPVRGYLRALWRRILHAWLACQIELRGRYSVQRMLAFDAYRHTVNTKRVLQLLFLTFLPCLLVEMALEAIPLGKLEAGPHTTGTRNFWIRTTIGTYILTHSLVGQYRQNISQLELSTRQLIGLSTLTTALVMPIFYYTATVVGFPVPFFVVLAMIPWTPIVVSISGFLLRHQLRRDPSILQLIGKYTFVFIAQSCLIVVYPTFSYIFNVHPSSQTALALLLPLIKLTFRNWFGYASRHIEDLKPELVVFNIEIFSALYVSSCMQSATSLSTTVVIMAVDILQAWLSIKDLDDVLNDKVLRSVLSRAAELADHDKQSSVSDDLIPLTMFILQTNAFVRQHPSVQIRTCAPNAETTVIGAARTQIVPTSAVGESAYAPRASIPNSQVKANQTMASPLPREKTRIQSTGKSRIGSSFFQFAMQRVSADQAPLGQLTIHLNDDEQLLVVQKTLQILHISEFMALIEYSEVFVPIVYSVFITVAYWFPNRHAFALLDTLTPSQFWISLVNVVIYGSLELMSFIALDQVMRRKFRVSAFAQTAFVLETQWPMVQSKLTLWMVVALQFAHSFYGNDFTFKFKWLHDPAT